MTTNWTKTVGAMAMIFFALCAFARERNELNGTWTLVPTKSNFAGAPAIQTGTVTIRDREGITVIERNFTYEGARETYFYSDSIGNEHGGTIHTAKDLKTKTKWDHDVLRVTTTTPTSTTVESYSLASDGTMMVNVETPGSKPVTLVFTKK
jgi:hypothetical protein